MVQDESLRMRKGGNEMPCTKTVKGGKGKEEENMLKKVKADKYQEGTFDLKDHNQEDIGV